MTEFEKYFRTKKYGGYSDCLDRGNGWVVPNCVGYCWGWFYFDRGEKDFSKHPKGNANTLYGACRPNGSGFWVS